MCVKFCYDKTKLYAVCVTIFLGMLHFTLCRPLCGKLSLLECKFVCLCDTENFTFNDAQDYAICEFWQKILKKGIIYSLKNLFLIVMFGGTYNLTSYIFAIFEWQMLFIYLKFCQYVMCNCGAVVECRARYLKDAGSRPACVIIVFNRWCAAHGKLSLLRIM